MEENSNNNSLHEPTAEYGVARKAKVSKWEHVRELAETSWSQDWTANPTPYTRDVLQARIQVVQAEIDAGVPGLTSEELFNRLETEMAWLKNYR